MRARLALLLILLLNAFNSFAQTKPSIPNSDRIRLAEAFKLADSIGDQVWTDWTKAPFAVLLVTPEYEFLLRHPKPSADFTPLGRDTLLKTDVYFRKRTQRPDFLATFPAINGSSVPTIVIGQAENTLVRTSTAWVVTILHEHFHQLQFSQPTYYTELNALDLPHGDQTGMWVLNYAFPYDRKEVQERFAALSKLLVEALNGPKSERTHKIVDYLRERGEFQRGLTPEDYRYLSLQLWQEGIARYTEYRIAKLASTKFKPSKEFRSLKDFTPFAQLAESIRERILRQLLTQKLGEARREVVYPFGAAEGLLLDQLSPRWRSRYLVDKFDLSKYYPIPK